MSGIKPERLQLLLQQFIVTQKLGDDVEGILSSIKAYVNAECLSTSISENEWTSSVAAIFAALRVGMKLSIASNKWVRDRIAYATVVHSCYKGLESRECLSVMGMLAKLPSFSPLLSCMLSNMDGDSVSLFALLQAVYDLCFIVLYNKSLKDDFVSMKYISLYGKVTYVCLEVASNRENDCQCRDMALKTLEALVDSSEENCDSLTVVLPGISTALANIVCQSASEHLRIIISSLKILSRTICYCLADSVQCNEEVASSLNLDPQVQELYVHRDDCWKASTAVNIKKLVGALCSSLALHRDGDVRVTLLECVYSLRNECRKAFKNSLDGFLLDLFLTTQLPSSSC
ncbi:hypothetical protein GCK32_000787, partial [Trichostrongylus colubriformis]